MSEFNGLLQNLTSKENPIVHGAIFKCVNKNGNEMYSKISGYDSISLDARPLREDAVFKIASCTKLFTSIALLQCIDRGFIGLDESVTKILPELDGIKILTGKSGSAFSFEPSKTPITPRHLLSHTSGMAYLFLDPLMIQWTKTPEGNVQMNCKDVSKSASVPLIFEPGSGWTYGNSLEWAGILVRRLHNNISLEDFMIENIWKKVGLAAPFPTFALSDHPDYAARLMQAVERTPDGGLKPWAFAIGDHSVDHDGGSGLSLTTKDMMAVLTDLISDSPKLLKPDTISLMFTPQIEENSIAFSMLLKLRPAWEHVAGPVPDDHVNHGLGGLLVVKKFPELGQPKGILCWGGATNPVWFICKEKGVAGFFATQSSPFAESQVKDLVNAWRKDFWAQFNGA
ncbi:beta-lactamase class C and other penicillin binding protein [Tothia fuscella]|uniref:Beta-lactamase class C and other penicillin binding protein n=1 Tax=Tothia fuscella TaxID=1048955 RepID=A0A9P4NDZ5_9PEZI|nr:beta-lactamase class C and other penicillin binding protein [Tothia fuscella]